MCAALCTPAEEKALQAWLQAGTPSAAGTGAALAGSTPSAMLNTPAVQGLLQKLKMSTPALGPQVMPQSRLWQAVSSSFLAMKKCLDLYAHLLSK